MNDPTMLLDIIVEPRQHDGLPLIMLDGYDVTVRPTGADGAWLEISVQAGHWQPLGIACDLNDRDRARVAFGRVLDPTGAVIDFAADPYLEVELLDKVRPLLAPATAS